MKISTRNIKKRLLVITLLCILIFSIISGCGKKEEEYRQIQVYKIDGIATVERQGSSMEAYENMQLQSGDMVETVAESYLQLKLDEDKYILIEPDSKISLQATGNSVDSKTSIYLEKGAIVNQLDHPLSEDSSYQVTTPNSTMAVRGTTFRVEITYDEKGHSYAKVAVYGGKVECHLVFPDGTIAEPVMVEPGKEVLVWGDDVESDYVEFGNTSYDELRERVIDFLGVIIDKGEELSITKEELAVLKEGLAVLEEDTTLTEENGEDSSLENSEQDSSLKEFDTTVKQEIVEEKPGKEETKTEEEVKQEETPEQPTQTTPPVVSTPDDSSTSTGGGSSSGGNSSSGSSSGGSSPGDNTSGGNSSGGSSSSGTTTSTRDVIINFKVNNALFATKTVSQAAVGSTVTIMEPTLQPDASGNWKDGSGNLLSSSNTVTVSEGEGALTITFTWSTP